MGGVLDFLVNRNKQAMGSQMNNPYLSPSLNPYDPPMGVTGNDMMQAEAKPQGGKFMDFLSQLVNPTTPLGQFGAAMLAQGGSPIGSAILNNVAMTRQGAKDATDEELKKAQAQYYTTRANNPQLDQSAQERMIARLLDPNTTMQEKTLLNRALSGFQYSPEGIAAVGAAAKSRAAGQREGAPPIQKPPTQTYAKGQIASDGVNKMIFDGKNWVPYNE